MNTTIDMAEDSAIVTTHIFNVSREHLFRAWTEPEQLAQWWGPKGFTNTFQEFDLRPGGNWRFIMHGPDGTDYPNHSIFSNIIAQERIEFDHISGHKFHVTADFEDLGEKSKLTWRMQFEDTEEFSRIKDYVTEGNRQNIEKLQAHLEG